MQITGGSRDAQQESAARPVFVSLPMSLIRHHAAPTPHYRAGAADFGPVAGLLALF